MYSQGQIVTCYDRRIAQQLEIPLAQSAAERMARLRSRQRGAGLATLTLVVPTANVTLFRRLAARQRQRLARGAPLTLFNSVLARRMTRDANESRVNPADIMETRELLEVAAVSLATRRLNPHLARRLRVIIADEAALDGTASAEQLQRFHLLLGELSGDPVLLLFLRLALRLTDEHSTFARRSRTDREAVVARLKHLHAAIATAIIERYEGLAIRRMRRYLSGLRDWLV
jgi:DNA-binding FadR family transcriptional regulator